MSIKANYNGRVLMETAADGERGLARSHNPVLLTASGNEVIQLRSLTYNPLKGPSHFLRARVNNRLFQYQRTEASS